MTLYDGFPRPVSCLSGMVKIQAENFLFLIYTNLYNTLPRYFNSLSKFKFLRYMQGA